MIYAFTGKTGSGKTFHMVKQAFKLWKQGRDVYSNTPLFFKDFVSSRKLAKCGKVVLFEAITDILEVRHALILFDEAQVLFDAQHWDSLPPEFKYKLQQHRKHYLDLFCTTQNLGTIDISYRRLVQFWFHHKDVWALFGIRNPSLFTIHAIEQKDIDCLYNSVDDLTVPNISVKYFFIHKWKRVLYTTDFDVGFHRFKTIWTMNKSNPESRLMSHWMIVPKELSLQDARRAISSLQTSPSSPKRWRSFSRN